MISFDSDLPEAGGLPDLPPDPRKHALPQPDAHPTERAALLKWKTLVRDPNYPSKAVLSMVARAILNDAG